MICKLLALCFSMTNHIELCLGFSNVNVFDCEAEDWMQSSVPGQPALGECTLNKCEIISQAVFDIKISQGVMRHQF